MRPIEPPTPTGDAVATAPPEHRAPEPVEAAEADEDEGGDGG